MPQLKPTRGIRLNKSHPLARGLVGCWPFNEGSGGQVFDLSGNGNTGTLVGNPSWDFGIFGALKFDGTGDYIAINNSPSLNNFGTGDFSIFARVKIPPRGDPSYGQIFNVEGTDPRYYLRFNDNASVYGGLHALIDDGPTSVSAWSNTIIDDNKEHQVGVVYDRDGNMQLYIDGKADGSGVSIAAVGSVNNNNDVRIGMRYSDIGDFLGLIDHVMVYNRALTASEIALLYREPFCMFERAWIPKLIGDQIVELAGSSVALSSSSATAKAMRKVGGNVVGTSDVAALLNLIHSLLYIERNWLREALFNGMTANAFKLGTTLSLGWFWVRVAGCSVLYRGSSMGEIDFVNILAVSEQEALEISPPSYISHNSGSTYFYVVRRFNNCGYQECTLAASVKVSIESNGELAELQPNKVFDSEAELVDGNKIQLVWYYCPLEQKSQPTCFNVYYDGRTGQIDYENPLAIIGYKRRKFYSYQCGAIEAGRYLFAIRTENASGKENSSLARLRIQFDPTNPAAIDILSVEGV